MLNQYAYFSYNRNRWRIYWGKDSQNYQEPNPTPSTRQLTTGREAFNSRSGYNKGTQDKRANIPKLFVFLAFRSVLWLCLCLGFKNFNHLLKIQTLQMGCWGYKKLILLEDLGWWEAKIRRESTVMAQTAGDELVVPLEGSLELSTMEQGVKMVGAVLADQQLNKWDIHCKPGIFNPT
ncbi:unnamed protein product [Malus baccata var. baccata]